MNIKVTLTDDHTLLRSGIKASLLCQNDFEVIGEVADGLTGIKLVERMCPDIVLLDLDMPVTNGCETLARIPNSNPQQTVMMLTVFEDNDDLTGYVCIGVHGFLLKNINADFLLDSACKAVDGGNVFSSEMITRLVQSPISPASPRVNHLLSILTPCEMGILGYPAAGHSSKVIARHLKLAESIIRVYAQNISRKLNLGSHV